MIAGCGGGSSGGGNSGGGGNGGGGESNPTAVTFTISGPTPTAVATQIGSGSFTGATLTAGQVTLSLPSGTTKFALAYVCPIAPPTNGDIAAAQTVQGLIEATTADGTSFSETCPSLSSTPSTGTLTGAVDATAIAGAVSLQIDAGGNGNLTDAIEPGASSSFSFAAPVGTDRVDVLAYGTVATSGPLAGVFLVGAKDFENQAVPGALNGGSPVVLGTADETTSESVTVTGVPAGFAPPIGAAFLLLGGESAGEGIYLTDAAATQYPVMPTGFLQSGDSYALILRSVAESADEGVEVTKTFTTPGPVSITLPTPWAYAGPAPAAFPTFNVAYSGFTGSGTVYNEMAVNWPANGTTQFLFQVTATANYLGGSSSVVFPDLSSQAGFFAAPASGTPVSWNSTLSQGPFPVTNQANATVTTVFNGGQYLVP